MTLPPPDDRVGLERVCRCGLRAPLHEDEDGDGTYDGLDNCPGLSNPDQAAPRTGLRACPPDTVCRNGCPDVRALVPGLMARIEAEAVADLPAGEGPLPILGMAMDTCAFVDRRGRTRWAWNWCWA